MLVENDSGWEEVIIPFIKTGIARGEKCFYIVDCASTEEIRKSFTEHEFYLDELEKKGQISIMTESQVYSRQGGFDPDAVIRLLQAETGKALRQGYTALRIIGEMSWALRGYNGSDRLLEFEAKLNRDLFPAYPCLAICQYDRSKFAPKIVKGTLLTHPLLIHGDQFYNNFYYLDPEEYFGHDKSSREVEHWLDNLERERRDREALRKQQKELRESKEKYQKLAESAGAILWEYDITSDRWTYVAPQVKKILGYDPEDWKDMNFWTEHLHPDDREWASQYCSRCTQRGEDHIFEYRFLKKDGGTVWLQDDVSVELKEGKPSKLRGFMIEITGRKEAENALRKLTQELEQRVEERTAQLEESNRELEAFTYTVSHDLRSPLRAIDGFTRILLEEYGGKLDEEGKRLLKVIIDNTQQMDQLITDLLVLSRVTRHQIKKLPVDMEGLLNAVYNEIISEDNLNSLDFVTGELPTGTGDPNLLRQVWKNLLGNAVKFTSLREKRIVEVGGYRESGYNIYFVKDNGVGFDPRYGNKIFGVFQRLHGAKEFSGTGIGLAIVQRVVNRHGGEVWAEGDLGKGAVFYFSLPVVIGREVHNE